MLNVDKIYVGKIIQLKRKILGLKQSELAELVGISEKHLSKIETGRNYPALDNFLKIAEVLKLSLRDFGAEEVATTDISESKNELKRMINVATESQVNAYSEIITVLNKHLK